MHVAPLYVRYSALDWACAHTCTLWLVPATAWHVSCHNPAAALLPIIATPLSRPCVLLHASMYSPLLCFHAPATTWSKTFYCTSALSSRGSKAICPMTVPNRNSKTLIFDPPRSGGLLRTCLLCALRYPPPTLSSYCTYKSGGLCPPAPPSLRTEYRPSTVGHRMFPCRAASPIGHRTLARAVLSYGGWVNPFLPRLSGTALCSIINSISTSIMDAQSAAILFINSILLIHNRTYIK